MRRLRSDTTERAGQNAAAVYVSSASTISKEDRIIRFHLRCSLQFRTILHAPTECIVVKEHRRRKTSYEWLKVGYSEYRCTLVSKDNYRYD